MEGKARIIVTALIKKNGKYLFVRQKKGDIQQSLWGTPGGKVKLGETPDQALIREVREETGLSVKILDFFNGYVMENLHPDYNVPFAILLIYNCKAISDKVKAFDDVDEYAWFTIPELKKLKLRPGVYLFLDDLEQSI